MKSKSEILTSLFSCEVTRNSLRQAIKDNPDSLELVERAMEENASQIKWVSVDKELPEEGQDVLVWCVYLACQESNVAFISEGRWVSLETDDTLQCKITHWQPLPEPPEK